MKQEFLSTCYTVDFETSGLEVDTAEIVEQGISHYTDGAWKLLHTRLHRCTIEIPPEASAVSNITSEMVMNEPIFNARNFPIGETADIVLVSHNAPYDSAVLKKYLDTETYNRLIANWLCTLRMAKKLYVNDPTFTQFNLSYLRYRLKLNVGVVNVSPHRAGYDSYLTGLLFEYIINVLESSNLIDPSQDYLPQISKWAAQPVIIELMPFGKHQGERIDKLPTSYLDWLVNKSDKLDETSIGYDEDFANSVLLAINDRF